MQKMQFMKTKILYRFVPIIALAAIVFACNKSNNSTPAAGQSDADLQTQSDDQTRVSNENDAVINDVNATLSGQPGVTGASVKPAPGYQLGIATLGTHDTIASLVCDAVVTMDTTANPYKITISYNGSTKCASTRTRTGTVVISFPAGQKWHDAGAKVTVSIQNLKITRLIDNKSITLNGTHLYTNVTGGALLNLPNLPNGITHTVTSDDMSITFDNGSQRTWHVARQRHYSYSNGLVISTTGTHTDGSTTGIAEWGTNRFGNTFVTAITQPLVITQACSLRLTAGEVKLIRPELTTTVTFGLDATGAATSCPGTGSYYFKLVWVGAAGKTYTFILPY